MEVLKIGHRLNDDAAKGSWDKLADNPDGKPKVSYCTDYSRFSFTTLGAFVEAMNGETYVPMTDYDEEEENE